jgi:hypothetical protein
MRKSSALAVALSVGLALVSGALADSPERIFADGVNGAKIHSASSFVCPQKIGSFERDAVGERDPRSGSVYCAYSKLDGVYGTIVLKPIVGGYDAKTSLAGEFEETESTGGHMIGENGEKIGPRADHAAVYTRTYEAAKLRDADFRILYAGAAIGNWALETTVEYSDPRDVEAETDFVNAVYSAAGAEIAQPQQAGPSAAH